jgi:SAM-dependent methyltransferase
MNVKIAEVTHWNALRRDALRKVRQVGLIRALGHGTLKLGRQVWRRVGEPEHHRTDFDLTYGTDTERIVSVGALDIAEESLAHSNRYEAVVPEAFHEIMERLPIAHQDFLFVDVGAGKGRALLLASFFPYKEIIGVDISAALTEVANRNVSIFRDHRQKCRAIRSLCIDGGMYTPPEENAVLYLQNPFDETVMRPFIASVEASLRKVPRKLFVVYHRPLHRALWDESIAFSVVHSATRYVIYESKR